MEYLRVGVWLVAFAVLAGAGLPIAARLFARVDGRGAGFALPVALVVLTTVAYWVGQVSYAIAPFVALVVLVGLALAASVDWSAVRSREGGWLTAGGLTRVRENPPLSVDIDRNAVVDTAVVFALAFLFLVAVRALDPAVHPGAGEKFLDYGLLKSLARAGSLPPEDMWFAGEPLAYYYGGHLMTSILGRLTATPPRFAYNLALAGFYAMLVTAAFDLAGAIGVTRGVPRRVAGAFAAFFVGLASNLFTPGRVLLGALPAGLQREAVELLATQTPGSTTEELLVGVDRFSYWTAHLVIPGTNNEFPLFAWLNGDLQGHMMGAPFLLLAAAVCYGYARTPGHERWRRRVLVFGAIPLLAWLQVVTVTWFAPSVLGLLWLTLALAPADPLTLFPAAIQRRVCEAVDITSDALGGRAVGSLRAEALRSATAFAVVGIVGAIGLALSLQFVVGAGAVRSVALVPADARSSLGGLVLVHGAFLVAFAIYLLTRLRPARPEYLLVALVALGWVSLGTQMPVLLLVGPLIVGGWVGLRLDRPLGFETVLIVAGAGLVAIVEFVYVVEQASPLRYNTVFKTYAQVWALWGTAAGVAVPGLLAESERVHAVRSRTAAGGRRVRDWPTRAGRSGTLSALLIVVLVVSTSIYGGLALTAHVQRADDPATLDATAFVERDHPDYVQALDYVENLPGQPTLLSAPATSRCLDIDGEYPCPPGMYDWHSSPAASLTGVPTVAGWAHEVGYRGAEAYYARARDVDAIYTGSAETQGRLLRRYSVDYVWVGEAERERYGSVSFRTTPGIERAFHAGAVTIYRVDAEELPE